MRFEVLAKSGQARLGRLDVGGAVLETPAFMPVGTYGAVKTLSPGEIEAMGYRLILANALHLFLRPGTETVSRMGGIKPFMGWKGALLTDSGGFQVLSLSSLRKVEDEGVAFRSPLDGARLFLTPEKAVAIQEELGADIAMMLDECIPYPATFGQAQEAMRRTHAWAVRARRSHQGKNALFAIVQGGMHEDLRRQSLEGLLPLGFEGYALGGLSVGEPREVTRELLQTLAPLLPEDKPRYLMGMGTPEDIAFAVASGVDLFDCVLPTRNARNGWLYTASGVVRIKNARHAKDPSPVEEGCPCPCCAGFSRAYLHHLHKSRETLGQRLSTLHNLSFYSRFLAGLREKIRQGNL